MKTREEQNEEDLMKRINLNNLKSGRLKSGRESANLQEIRKGREIKPSSPSHPKNLYGSASSMTTNWDW